MARLWFQRKLDVLGVLTESLLAEDFLVEVESEKRHWILQGVNPIAVIDIVGSRSLAITYHTEERKSRAIQKIIAISQKLRERGLPLSTSDHSQQWEKVITAKRASLAATHH